MKRRTLVRKLGAAGIGAAALSGSAAARRPSATDLGIDRDIDVSSVEGEVTLDELLAPHELEDLPADVDPSRRITIAPEAVTINTHDCCTWCPTEAVMDCTCICCVEERVGCG